VVIHANSTENHACPGGTEHSCSKVEKSTGEDGLVVEGKAEPLFPLFVERTDGTPFCAKRLWTKGTWPTMKLSKGRKEIFPGRKKAAPGSCTSSWR